MVSEDDSRRRLGSYSAAAWSPNVIFVALADGRQLAVAEPDGKLRWSITAPAKVADLVWAAPSGSRIAYRAGRELRVVEGTGAADRSVADAVAAVGPAWRPGAADDSGPYELAFVGRDGRIRLADPDDPAAEPVLGPSSVSASHLLWLDADRLAAIDRGRIVILDSRLRATERIPLPGGGEVTAADVAPEAGRIALARSESSYPPRSKLLLIRVGRNLDEVRSVFSIPGEYAGLSFSPDERWIAAGWPEADSWLMVKRRADLKTLDQVKVYKGLQRQFDPGGNSPGSLRPPRSWTGASGLSPRLRRPWRAGWRGSIAPRGSGPRYPAAACKASAGHAPAVARPARSARPA